MSKYIEYSAYTGCISLYIYCLITCNIKSLLNVPKISHISRKFSQVSRFPAKSPDSRNKFVFLPKQPLLELSPPVTVKVLHTKPGDPCTQSPDVNTCTCSIKATWQEWCSLNAKPIRPFAPGNVAEKRVLKLVEPFSGHRLAIKILNVPQSRFQVVHLAVFWSRCKIFASEVR